jgi:hypothetical protein
MVGRLVYPPYLTIHSCLYYENLSEFCRNRVQLMKWCAEVANVETGQEKRRKREIAVGRLMTEAEVEWTIVFLPCKLRLHAHPQATCEDATIMFTPWQLGLESTQMEVLIMPLLKQLAFKTRGINFYGCFCFRIPFVAGTFAEWLVQMIQDSEKSNSYQTHNQPIHCAKEKHCLNCSRNQPYHS